jgi:hypothetical protein
MGGYQNEPAKIVLIDGQSSAGDSIRKFVAIRKSQSTDPRGRRWHTGRGRRSLAVPPRDRQSKPVFTYNLIGVERVRSEGPQALPEGKHTVVFDYKYDGLGMATLAYNNMSGIGALSVNGIAVTTQKMAHSTPLLYNLDDTFNIVTSTATSLDDRDTKVPFPFTGKLNKLTIAVDEPVLSEQDRKTLVDAERRASD